MSAPAIDLADSFDPKVLLNFLAEVKGGDWEPACLSNGRAWPARSPTG